MIDSWFDNSDVAPGKVDDEVQNDRSASYDRAQGSLIGTVANAHVEPSLPAEINALFGGKFDAFVHIDWEMIDNFMAGSPVWNNTLGDRLNLNGDYYLKINNARILAAKDQSALPRQGAQQTQSALLLAFRRNQQQRVRNKITNRYC